MNEITDIGRESGSGYGDSCGSSGYGYAEIAGGYDEGDGHGNSELGIEEHAGGNGHSHELSSEYDDGVGYG